MSTALQQFQGIEKLLKLMEALRDPETGCPWDVEQTWETIAPYTIEEAYEVLDAIQNGGVEDVKDELGDLLLQVVFQSRIAEEDGLFSFADVARHVADKMISRHPHVFGDKQAQSADDVVDIWEAQKQGEKVTASLMDQITIALPALMRAQKIQKKAIKAGFKWSDPRQAFAKLREEIDELEAAYDADNTTDMAEEYGDVLFSAALIGRYLSLDAEESLRDANNKFIKRFKGVEKAIDINKLNDLNEVDIIRLWDQAKQAG